MLAGHASCVDRPQTYDAVCPLNPANRTVVAGWPMPSGGGKDQPLNTALSHLLLRQYAQVVDTLARMCGRWAFRLLKRALAPQGAVNYADLAAARA